MGTLLKTLYQSDGQECAQWAVVNIQSTYDLSQVYIMGQLEGFESAVAKRVRSAEVIDALIAHA